MYALPNREFPTSLENGAIFSLFIQANFFFFFLHLFLPSTLYPGSNTFRCFRLTHTHTHTHTHTPFYIIAALSLNFFKHLISICTRSMLVSLLCKPTPMLRVSRVRNTVMIWLFGFGVCVQGAPGHFQRKWEILRTASPRKISLFLWQRKRETTIKGQGNMEYQK